MDINENLFDMSGKTALIAGASRGIGEASAKLLAAFGANVICSSRKLEDCERVASEIREAGGKARAMTLHLGELDHHDTAIADIMDKEGRIDFLMNNGATNPYFGMAGDTPVGAWDKTIEVNLRGPWYLSSKVIKVMQKQGSGSIVNVASVNGSIPGMAQGIYSVTKAAIISMTKVFAMEYGRDGIRVNSLSPGFTDTKIASALKNNDAIQKKMMEALSVQRMAQPEEMAGMVLYLASEASSYVTGQDFVVDGGYLSRR